MTVAASSSAGCSFQGEVVVAGHISVVKNAPWPHEWMYQNTKTVVAKI